MRLIWDAALTEKVLALAAQGMPCRAIGDALGLSKNRIVGKLFRLRKEGRFRSSLEKKSTKAILGRKRKIIAHKNGKIVFAKFSKSAPPQIDRTDEPPSFQVELLDLEPSQCRYPHGEGSSIRFCGHPVVKGSYCAFHAKICHVEERDAE